MGLWDEFKSAAYHEAGHVVAAVIQGLPLCEDGMRIDLKGKGVSRYCLREPGIRSSTDEDDLQRRKTIISLFSGQIAQTKFLPYLDEPTCWQDDDRLIEALVKEMTVKSEDQIKKQLYCDAKVLIDKHWLLVKELAQLLLQRPETQMTDEEFAAGWSASPDRREKCLSTTEIKNYFLTRKIKCEVQSV